MARINAPRIFEITELATLIFRYTELPVCARMCRVSKSMFYAAAPSAWEHVDGIQNLLKLLPEIFVRTPVSRKLNIVSTSSFLTADRSTFFAGTQIIPGSINLNTVRFEIYAPFVKSLEVYSTNMDYEVSGLGNLLALSSQRTLLPSLISLTMSPTRGNRLWCISLWVQIFASESLTTILSIPTSPDIIPSISLRAFSVAIKSATECCPRLQKVMLFLTLVAGDPCEEDALLDLLYDKPYHHYLLSTSSLREMTCSLCMLEEDGLDALSELPLLERLEIYSNDLIPRSYTRPSDHSFSSLRYLNLNLLTWQEADWTLRLRSLLTGLTTLKVLIASRSNSPSSHWVTETFLPALVHATYLEHLAVDLYDPDRLYLGEYVEVENMNELNVLSQLPLQTVRLSPIEFRSLDASAGFGKLWSKVTYLDLPETNISLESLPVFTRFPTLEHLVLKLYIDPRGLPEDGDTHETTGSRLHTLEGSKFSDIECSSEDKDTHLEIARYV
ncbi:hypothetical protein FRC09_001671 [Ceratobasidium sp. 395]|nr:hypothetical protein FRC09_001671 [Ceratobasidium sp. 395]